MTSAEFEFKLTIGLAQYRKTYGRPPNRILVDNGLFTKLMSDDKFLTAASDYTYGFQDIPIEHYRVDNGVIYLMFIRDTMSEDILTLK